MSRLLIVTYHFPPMLTMGAVRMQRFARHLESAGWSADILTADESRCARRDPGMTRTLPAGMRLFRESADAVAPGGSGRPEDGSFGRKRRPLRPGGFAKKGAETLRRWVPSVSEPNSWRRKTVVAGRQIIAANRYQLIYSSSGPLASHSVAAELAETGRLPWVAEFRDAVLDSPYLYAPTPWHRRYYRAREGELVRRATLVVVTSHSHRTALQNRYGGIVPVRVLPNGYDLSEYPERPERDASQFVVCYAGNLYGARSIKPFLHGWREWVTRRTWPDRTPWLHIYGESFNADLVSLVRKLGLASSVAVRGSRTHADVMAAVASSDAVLVVKSPEDRIHIPGKLYEALGSGRPVLLLGQESEASDLVRRFDAGVAVPTLNAGAIADALDQVAVRAARPLDPPPEFAIEHLTGRLAEIFAEATRSKGVAQEVGTDGGHEEGLRDHAH